MKTFWIAALVACALGCDIPDRVSRLEKQTRDFQSEKDRVVDYDLQARCGKESREWFTQNWPSDKDTKLLDYANHYNKKANKCFVLVEYHYNSKLAGPGGTSWTNQMTLWNVSENDKFGDFAENHYIYYKPQVSTRDEVITCELSGQKCKAVEEFNNLARPYMNE